VFRSSIIDFICFVLTVLLIQLILWFNVFMHVFTVFYKSEKTCFNVFYSQINVFNICAIHWLCNIPQRATCSTGVCLILIILCCGLYSRCDIVCRYRLLCRHWSLNLVRPLYIDVFTYTYYLSRVSCLLLCQLKFMAFCFNQCWRIIHIYLRFLIKKREWFYIFLK